MGMFDEFIWTCKHCYGVNTAQSKAGECELITYHEHRLEVMHLAMIADLEEFPEYCEKCNTKHILKTQKIISGQMVIDTREED
jgi:hypothetical protein